jgi:hypothetical protein
VTVPPLNHIASAKKLASATVSQYISASHSLFLKTLRRHFLAKYIPFPKSLFVGTTVSETSALRNVDHKL